MRSCAPRPRRRNSHHRSNDLGRQVALYGPRRAAILTSLNTTSGRDTRIFVGTYAMRLRKSGGAWRIYRFRYDLKFMDGNPDLEGEA